MKSEAQQAETPPKIWPFPTYKGNLIVIDLPKPKLEVKPKNDKHNSGNQTEAPF